MHEFMTAVRFDDRKVVGTKLNLHIVEPFWVGIRKALKDNRAIA